MLSYEEQSKNNEIGKLIQFGYDLHKRDMQYYNTDEIPSFESYYGDAYPIKKVKGGGIFGVRGYPNHSESWVYTILGVTVGKPSKKGFKLEYAQMMQTGTKDYKIYFSNLKKNDNSKRWYETLDYDRDNSWADMSDEDKEKTFIRTMEFIGFRKEDVIAVLNGTLTAREAYMNVAPEEIKNLQWVSKGRRMFVFDKNVAIEGSFGSMDMDHFPFPFSEQPILDCSKVNTSGIWFENNYRRVKLINVNSNPNSISYVDLKNAIIDEPIDLALVDATETKFGHHVVINLELSIAKLEKMDLTLAVNENGERYKVDEKGVAHVGWGEYPETIPNDTREKSNIQILANADNISMTKDAIDNECDGIGLVRTEHIFTDLEDVKMMVQLLDYSNEEDYEKNLKRFKELQTKQVRDILSVSGDKPVVFRLLDFKLKEFLKVYGLTINCNAEIVKDLRGAYVLYQNEEILIAQIEAIFDVADRLGVDVNLLIPLIRTTQEFKEIKKIIIETSKKYNLKGLRIGAMIENIEMCNDADELATDADFISIGTNDLTESITGLSRDTNSLEFHELTEDVKASIEEAIYRARTLKPDIVIGICGEHSNYIENIPFYNNIGVDYITCSSDFIKTNREFLCSSLELGSSKVRKLFRTDINGLNKKD